METLKFVSLLEGGNEKKSELMLQFTGGGASIALNKGMSSAAVVLLLRKLADTIEKERK
jgi:hypothetical protein